MMKRAIRAGITGALLIGGVAGLTAMSTISPMPMASGTGDISTAVPFVDRTPFGTLEVQTGPDGQLTIVVAEIGKTPVTADFSVRKPRCRVDLGALGEYLGLVVVDATVGPDANGQDVVSDSPTARDVGLVDQGLGSRDQNNCNRSNGRLEDGQGFAITLGSMFDDVVFDYGVLDIEAKYGADLFAQTTLLGGTPTTYADPLSNASDNDADAQGADNNLVPIGAQPAAGEETGPADDDFDRLVILPISSDGRGQISLEGGGDYAATGQADQNRTVFHLVRSKTYEYTLVCDAPLPDEGGNYPANDAGEVKGIVETPAELDWSAIVENPSGTVDYPSSTRVFRHAGFETVEGVRVAKPCPAIGASLSADGDGVLLEPSTENAFLRVEVTWVIPAALVDLAKGDADGDPFARQIDVDGDGDGLPEPARYCESFDGADSFDPGAAGDAIHPADTPWCVLTDERTLTQIDPDGEGPLGPVDVVIQRMVWNGEGDPRFF